MTANPSASPLSAIPGPLEVVTAPVSWIPDWHAAMVNFVWYGDTSIEAAFRRVVQLLVTEERPLFQRRVIKERQLDRLNRMLNNKRSLLSTLKPHISDSISEKIRDSKEGSDWNIK